MSRVENKFSPVLNSTKNSPQPQAQEFSTYLHFVFILCMYFVIMLNYLQVVNIQFFLIYIGTMYVSKGK